jgi:hypothetical protein
MSYLLIDEDPAAQLGSSWDDDEEIQDSAQLLLLLMAINQYADQMSGSRDSVTEYRCSRLYD